jgi:hypothetical protein
VSSGGGLSVRAVHGCDGASVSVPEADGQVSTVAASDQRTARLDELQHVSDEGPCLTAIHTGAIVQVDVCQHRHSPSADRRLVWRRD